MAHFLLIRGWRNLKHDICTRVYSITYARVRIVYDKSYRVDRPLNVLKKVHVHLASACATNVCTNYDIFNHQTSSQKN